jgi:glyoxylase-like metal-dependent hydrolase (beta-lactamase superfamily II)
LRNGSPAKRRNNEAGTNRMNPETGLDTLKIIDCHYIAPRRAASYLLLEDNRAAFVDNNTVHAVPYLLEGLKNAGKSPEQVEYLIVTHVHLDHAGGTAALLAHCPNAAVLAHERAARHLIDPSRLIAGSKQVYGEKRYNELYGQIDPIDEARVRVVNDEDVVKLGNRELRILYTPGHAKHHLCIYDADTNSVIAGDNFGNAYPGLQNGDRPFIFFCSAPTDFEPAAAKASAQRLIDTGADRIHVAHYGTIENPKSVVDDLFKSIDRMEAVQNEAAGSDVADDALAEFCERRVQEELYKLYEDTGASLTDQARKDLELDVWLNWNGVHWNAMKARKDS